VNWRAVLLVGCQVSLTNMADVEIVLGHGSNIASDLQARSWRVPDPVGAYSGRAKKFRGFQGLIENRAMPGSILADMLLRFRREGMR